MTVVISTVGGVCRTVVISTVGGGCRTVVISTVGGVFRTVPLHEVFLRSVCDRKRNSRSNSNVTI